MWFALLAYVFRDTDVYMDRYRVVYKDEVRALSYEFCEFGFPRNLIGG